MVKKVVVTLGHFYKPEKKTRVWTQDILNK